MGVIADLATLARPVLSLPIVRRVRRNHGLEHATIHILTRSHGGLRLAGRSDNGGFFLYGSVPTPEVERAAREALSRMRAGQHDLAIHPNCGTNLLTTGTLATLAALLGLAGAESSLEKKLERFPTILVLVMGVLILAPGLGLALQRHFTTLGEPGDLEIIRIEQHEVRSPFGPVTVHRVDTANG